jgi:hypothetical protein
MGMITFSSEDSLRAYFAVWYKQVKLRCLGESAKIVEMVRRSPVF